MKTCFIVLLMAVAPSVVCQTNSEKHHIGLSGELFFNDVFRISTPDPSLNALTAKGYQYGIVYKFGLNERLWLQNGVSYYYTKHQMEGYYEPWLMTHESELFVHSLGLAYDLTGWLCLQAGLLTHYQKEPSTTYIHRQSGLGFFSSLGIELPLTKRLYATAGPSVSVFSLLPFQPEDHQQRFLLLGLQGRIFAAF